MSQSDAEKNALDSVWDEKSKIAYSNPYFSSAVDRMVPTLGTIESDVSGRYGRWQPEEFRASRLARLAWSVAAPATVLDIGGGNMLAADYFNGKGSSVDVCDFPSSPYLSFRDNSADSPARTFYAGDFNSIQIEERYDLVWASHVLEHQENVGSFLKKVVAVCSEDGYIALAVPPRKPFIVSGHINLFNPGLLVYRVILAGVDCSNAKIFQYDNNICLLVKRVPASIPPINYDIGDLGLLKRFFPKDLDITEGFNGDFMHCGFTGDDFELAFGA